MHADHDADHDTDHAADRDTDHLRRAIAVAAAAREAGNHPFGAVLVDGSGAVVLEAQNTVTTDHDVTGHAETNLVRLASRTLVGTDLSAYTLVTSCEPCAMCAGAVYWSGIGRIVYGLSESALREITGAHPANPTLAHPCRLVLADGSRRVEVSGPLLEDEAAVVHDDFWTT
ncbi:nucleoside deaminase [Nocardioides sp.]|uniref:nucleoside deaminase n=1 Tax=Nocardioides sp. TaxID=35761 RepID=UPI00271D932D|nr:nucleoside deaminase [Nocardioides sp.]MDO9457371.1 nucleoside deaminase [Nocardioides sp.]